MLLKLWMKSVLSHSDMIRNFVLVERDVLFLNSFLIQLHIFLIQFDLIEHNYFSILSKFYKQD